MVRDRLLLVLMVVLYAASGATRYENETEFGKGYAGSGQCDDAGQTPEKDVDAKPFKIANPENMMEEFCSPPTSDSDNDQLLGGCTIHSNLELTRSILQRHHHWCSPSRHVSAASVSTGSFVDSFVGGLKSK